MSLTAGIGYISREYAETVSRSRDDHIAEAYRRAALGGRLEISVCDFPPCVSSKVARKWIAEMKEEDMKMAQCVQVTVSEMCGGFEVGDEPLVECTSSFEAQIFSPNVCGAWDAMQLLTQR